MGRSASARKTMDSQEAKRIEFGGYAPLDEPEMHRHLAMDIVTTVSALLRCAGTGACHGDLSPGEIRAAGVLLLWAYQCLLEREAGRRSPK